MRVKFLAALTAVLCLGWSTGAAAYEETRELRLPEAGERLEVDCGAGSLEITGRGGASGITVEAEIVVEHAGRGEARELIEDRLVLSLERRGNRAVLTSEIDNDDFGFWRSLFHDAEMRVNLTVTVPAGFDLDIDDGSGDMRIENAGYVVIDDGSGNMTIRDAGELQVEDGSGDITIRDTGKIYIDDGSGDIDISVVNGEVELDDGSGNITLTDVRGHVIIDDASGEIDVRDVDDGVVIDDSSGNIVMNGITGDVHIDDGSGDIRVTDVRGSVEVRDGSGSIDVRRVTRDLVVREDGSGGIAWSGVDGSVRTPDD